MIEKLYKFHRTKQGYLVFGLAEFALAYVFGSIAVDTASMWAYLATIVLLASASLNFAKLALPARAKPKGKK